MNDYHSILGVETNATADVIKEAYRKLAKKFHPDLNGGDQFFVSHFRKIQDAYEALMSPQPTVKAQSSTNKTQQNISAEKEFEEKIFAYKKQNEMFRTQQKKFATNTTNKTSIFALKTIPLLSLYCLCFVGIAFFVILLLNPKLAVSDAITWIIKIAIDAISISLPLTAILIGSFLLYKKVKN